MIQAACAWCLPYAALPALQGQGPLISQKDAVVTVTQHAQPVIILIVFDSSRRACPRDNGRDLTTTTPRPSPCASPLDPPRAPCTLHVVPLLPTRSSLPFSVACVQFSCSLIAYWPLFEGLLASQDLYSSPCVYASLSLLFPRPPLCRVLLPIDVLCCRPEFSVGSAHPPLPPAGASRCHSGGHGGRPPSSSLCDIYSSSRDDRTCPCSGHGGHRPRCHSPRL